MRYSGIFGAATAFVIWGLLPIYWKQLLGVPAYEILCHRMGWSAVTMLLLLLLMGRWSSFLQLFRQRRQLFYFFLTASILAINWLIYIWAVNSGYIIESSLGYFINPLVSVCLGVVFLKETIRPLQWFCVVLAFIGVAYLTWSYGRLPWIAIGLALTFGFYGLFHKVTVVSPLLGLGLETILLFPFVFIALISIEVRTGGAFLHGEMSRDLLLIGTGVATTVPLLLFCSAAQKIPLYLVGLLQYLAPTMNLLVGIFLYHEEFSYQRAIGFCFIWAGLAIFATDGFVRQIRLQRVQSRKNKAME